MRAGDDLGAETIKREPRVPFTAAMRPDNPEILIIGANTAERRAAETLLIDLGYQVACTHTEDGACGRTRRPDPDLIVVIDAPQLPAGAAPGESARHNPALAGIPRLLVVARKDPGLLARCRRAHANDFVTTPLDAQELHARVRALLHRDRSRLGRGANSSFEGPHSPNSKRSAVRRTAANEPLPADAAGKSREGTRSNAPQIRCKAVVLFADMRGFTAMSERLDPPTVLQALNEFFPALMSIARDHRGKVFGIAGDSLMTGFGVPVEESDAPLRAVRSAWDMLTRFDELSDRWHDRFDVRVGLGVGIDVGDVVAGYVGASGLESYTLVGDAVNTAARLTGRARAGEFLASTCVLDAARSQGFDRQARRLPALDLKGKSAPFDAWAVTIAQRKRWTPAAASIAN